MTVAIALTGVGLGFVGVGLTILGIILGYIWRANARLLQILIAGQERLQGGLERIQAGLGKIAEILNEMDKRRAEDTKYLAELITRISRP